MLLLGKMLCYVVNLTPLSSHLLIQKTFPRAVKFDIFKESQPMSQKLSPEIQYCTFLSEGGRRGGERERTGASAYSSVEMSSTLVSSIYLSPFLLCHLSL